MYYKKVEEHYRHNNWTPVGGRNALLNLLRRMKKFTANNVFLGGVVLVGKIHKRKDHFLSRT